MPDSFLIATILAIVEGLTEFIPVSSTGHLIIVSDLLSLHGEKIKAFEVFIQLGAILAVISLYRERFIALLNPSASNAFSGFGGLLRIGLGCFPVLVIGALFHKQIKHYLFGTATVAWALIVGGIIMLFIEKLFKKPQVVSLGQISPLKALMVGLVQCLALWPGMSRSASSIIGGMLSGLDKKVAAEFSFILAVPLLAAAALFDLIKIYGVLTAYELLIFVYGALVSFFVARLGIVLLLKALTNWSLRPFGIYRIILGLVLLLR